MTVPKDVTIVIIDINDAAPIFTSDPTFNVAENQTAVWFSATLKVGSEVKIGAASLISMMTIVTSFGTVTVPSLTVSVIE